MAPSQRDEELQQLMKTPVVKSKKGFGEGGLDASTWLSAKGNFQRVDGAPNAEDGSSSSSKRFCPEEEANWFSMAYFLYCDGLIKAGKAKHLEQHDLWDIAREDDASGVYARFNKHLQSTVVPGTAPKVRARRPGARRATRAPTWATKMITNIYEKSLRVTSAVKSELGVGAIVNLQSNDASKIWNIPLYLHIVWNGPFQIFVVMALLVRIMGWAPAMAGLAVTVVMIPLSTLVGKSLGTARRAMVKQTDARVKLATEIITGIKAIKLYAWEKPYEERIHQLREQELVHIRYTQMLSMLNTAVFQSGPVLVSLAAFGVHSAMGYSLTAAVAFPALALFNLLRFPIIIHAAMQPCGKVVTWWQHASPLFEYSSGTQLDCSQHGSSAWPWAVLQSYFYEAAKPSVHQPPRPAAVLVCPYGATLSIQGGPAHLQMLVKLVTANASKC
ncbi:uncharacterized protein HaLaN_11907 [Haematococcus lacustris]|uniref:ABC transmembrane type-1 domain-containing protein n=1 Tax=Haematococcus lacustris TaxID=44745 RepID=A0A699Z8W8_HAELA|nr:uncharacterized protein HaLaN_11907 [Haematococcus lacustris]